MLLRKPRTLICDAPLWLELLRARWNMIRSALVSTWTGVRDRSSPAGRHRTTQARDRPPCSLRRVAKWIRTYPSALINRLEWLSAPASCSAVLLFLCSVTSRGAKYTKYKVNILWYDPKRYNDALTWHSQYSKNEKFKFYLRRAWIGA